MICFKFDREDYNKIPGLYRGKHERPFLAPVFFEKECLVNYFHLPSLSEQKAIVLKVEALIQKLDKLEMEVSQNQKTADMLMQSVLKEAFRE